MPTEADKNLAPPVEPIAPQAAQPQVKLDDAHVTANYANFCRVTATPEEVFLDFGLNEDPFGAGPKVITIERRVIVTLLGSKVLLAELSKALAGYEAEHGVIELDVQKRVKKQD